MKRRVLLEQTTSRCKSAGKSIARNRMFAGLYVDTLCKSVVWYEEIAEVKN